MHKLILTTLLLAFTTSLFSQYVWKGTGDGTSWEDPANWNLNEVPKADSTVTFNTSDTITGVASVAPIALKVSGKATVTLALDLTIGDGAADENVITINDTSTLILGLPGNSSTFTINAEPKKQAISIRGGVNGASLVITEGAILNLESGVVGINLASSTSTVQNNGTINFSANLRDGARVASNFTNSGTINGAAVQRDLFNVKEGGALLNENGATINSDQPDDDGVELLTDAIFTNEGILLFTAKDNAGSGNNAIAVGDGETAGTFINTASGAIVLSGGGGDGDLSGRALAIDTFGVVTNSGTITLNGGAENNRLWVRGEFTNEMNATVDLGDGRFNVNEGGELTNNGLFVSARAMGSGGNNSGIATNNAFFDYANSNTFAGGSNGETNENGISLNNNDTRVNARNACTADLANAPYEWFLDGVAYATASDTGALAFAANSLLADSVVLTTTVPGVEIKVVNICTEAVMTSSIFGARPQVQSISVYPNPISAGGALRLDLDGLSTEMVTVNVYNGTGVRMATAAIRGGSTGLLQLGDLPTGIYYLQGEQRGKVFSSKFLIR